jgi:GT2 family glycosyltransferase
LVAEPAALVDLIIVNYRSYQELTRCLASLEHARDRFGHVAVVDHEADLGAAGAVSARFPWVEIIERKTNEGFAAGVNLGARRGHAPFLLVLNPDCVADGTAVGELVSFATAQQDAAVIGPRILNPDLSVQGSARRFPGLSTFIAGRSSWLTRRFPNNPLSRRNLPWRSETSETREVDWVSGACMLVRRSAFEQVGGMDERFFLYWEDADLCKRLAEHGWRIVYFPGVTIEHAGGASSIHAYRESLAAFHTSAYTLFTKHASPSVRWLAPLVFLALQVRLRVLLFVHRHRLTSARPAEPAPSSRL